jgi:hypothetical protein
VVTRLARRVHSRYDRRLADTAIGGQSVVLRLRVRRFFCDTTECAVRTFTEQPAGVATPYASVFEPYTMSLRC